MSRDQLHKDLLEKYITKEAIDLYLIWQNQHPHQLVITRPRKSKLGDYRPPSGKRHYHKITVNCNLNKYEFFVTLIHEVAHLFTFVKYARHAAPHGIEWKNIYSKLLKDAILANCFPQNILPQLTMHINNPSASSCVDVELHKTLRQFNTKIKYPLVEEISQGEKFILRGGKHFIRGPLLRKRYRCEELGTGKIYAVSPIAEVLVREYDNNINYSKNLQKL